MKEVTVYYYESFTDVPHKGNPAAVVFQGDELSEEEMQDLAKKIGLNETTFVLSSENAKLRLRYFTPGHEMNLCGHGTIAAIYGWKEQNNTKEINDIKVETKAGILGISYNSKEKEVTMAQSDAIFMEFGQDREKIAKAIGLSVDDLDSNYPIVYGNTGIWTLIVPIKRLEAFQRMIPNNKIFPDILKEMPNSSVHPISLEVYHASSTLHGRHFSSPKSGTIEDPVTGTASGVMGAYYISYIKKLHTSEILVEQGQEIGRDGIVKVFATKKNNGVAIKISGKAVFVKKKKIIIE